MILIRTHHKTGSVWMHRVFDGVANILQSKYCNLMLGYDPDAYIYHAPHAPFPEHLMEGEFIGLHVIRDPRDVILSGMHYHGKADEAWLKVPNPDFGGMSYQEKLNSLDDDQRLYFEMEQTGGWTTREMLNWDYGDARFFEAHYEDLIEPSGMVVFGRILSFMGIEGDAAKQSLEWFRLNSLSSTNYVRNGDPHVRSGRPRQWQTELHRRHGERFLALMGDSLVRLGYEKDDSWVDSLAE